MDLQPALARTEPAKKTVARNQQGGAIFSESFVPDNLYCDRLYGSSIFSVCKEFVYESLFFSADAFRQGSTALADMDSKIWRCSAADDDDDRCRISVLAG